MLKGTVAEEAPAGRLLSLTGESLVKHFGQLGGVVFSVFGVTSCTFFVLVVLGAHEFPQCFQEFFAVGENLPGLLDEASLVSPEAQRTPIKIHLLQAKLFCESLDPSESPIATESGPLKSNKSAPSNSSPS
jgi:hypothetical protein